LLLSVSLKLNKCLPDFPEGKSPIVYTGCSKPRKSVATTGKHVPQSHPPATEIVETHTSEEKWWRTRASRSLLWIYKLQSRS